MQGGESKGRKVKLESPEDEAEQGEETLDGMLRQSLGELSDAQSLARSVAGMRPHVNVELDEKALRRQLEKWVLENQKVKLRAVLERDSMNEQEESLKPHGRSWKQKMKCKPRERSRDAAMITGSNPSSPYSSFSTMSSSDLDSSSSSQERCRRSTVSLH